MTVKGGHIYDGSTMITENLETDSVGVMRTTQLEIQLEDGTTLTKTYPNGLPIPNTFFPERWASYSESEVMFQLKSALNNGVLTGSEFEGTTADGVPVMFKLGYNLTRIMTVYPIWTSSP